MIKNLHKGSLLFLAITYTKVLCCFWLLPTQRFSAVSGYYLHKGSLLFLATQRFSAVSGYYLHKGSLLFLAITYTKVLCCFWLLPTQRFSAVSGYYLHKGSLLFLAICFWLFAITSLGAGLGPLKKRKSLFLTTITTMLLGLYLLYTP